MMRNSMEQLALAGLLLIAPGCASDAGQRGSAAQSAAEPAPAELSLSSFSERIDALQQMQAQGDAGRFAGARDSLVADVNQYIRNHPHAEDDPGFAGLLNSLSALDTLATDTIVDEGEFVASEDSLAQALSWGASGVYAP